jgi:uncharacterized coiled-coil protein SlyX
MVEKELQVEQMANQI